MLLIFYQRRNTNKESYDSFAIKYYFLKKEISRDMKRKKRRSIIF